MGTLVVINVDGSERRIEAKKPEYRVLYQILGGYCERIRVRYEGRIRDAYVDEEGLLRGKSRNERIEQMLDGVFKDYRGPIVGTAVIWVPSKKS